MPLLDVELQKFPTQALQGQLEEVKVVLTNSGKSNLNKVRVKLSHPNFFSFGETSSEGMALKTLNNFRSIYCSLTYRLSGTRGIYNFATVDPGTQSWYFQFSVPFLLSIRGM